jgi:hypothetical protein
VDITASATDTANVALRRMAGLRGQESVRCCSAAQRKVHERLTRQLDLLRILLRTGFGSVARSPDQRTLGSRVPESGGHPDALRARDELSEAQRVRMTTGFRHTTAERPLVG